MAEQVDTLTSIIDDYEAEQARVCATVPDCRTDTGARRVRRPPRDFSSDWNHNLQAQAAAAEITWPAVAALLAL